MIASHSEFFCGPETHFFRKYPRDLDTKNNPPAEWRRRACAFLESLTINGMSVREGFHLTKEEVADFLSRRQPSLQAALESLTANSARKHGKKRWAEKTPNHMLCLRTIRRHYPRAPIVRIIRDPRDAALSMRKLPWAPKAFVANLYLWRSWDEVSWTFFERDARAYTIRYEDLLAHPEAVLKEVSIAADIEFEKSMLVNRSSVGLAVPGEWWKDDVLAPLDPSRAEQWRLTLTRAEGTAAHAIVREALLRYGYPCEALEIATHVQGTLGNYLRARDIADCVRPCSARVVRSVPYMRCDNSVNWGDLLRADHLIIPERPLPQGSVPTRLFALLHLLRVVLGRRFVGRPTQYREPSDIQRSNTNRLDRLARLMFRALLGQSDGDAPIFRAQNPPHSICDG